MRVWVSAAGGGAVSAGGGSEDGAASAVDGLVVDGVSVVTVSGGSDVDGDGLGGVVRVTAAGHVRRIVPAHCPLLPNFAAPMVRAGTACFRLADWRVGCDFADRERPRPTPGLQRPLAC